QNNKQCSEKNVTGLSFSWTHSAFSSNFGSHHESTCNVMPTFDRDLIDHTHDCRIEYYRLTP
ncbi:MAG: hypothetical protein JW697_08885, partial [Kosmotogaceae bacterium]|nr:hypothetical protein [Kosmotogaceae bacterium]